MHWRIFKKIREIPEELQGETVHWKQTRERWAGSYWESLRWWGPAAATSSAIGDQGEVHRDMHLHVRAHTNTHANTHANTHTGGQLTLKVFYLTRTLKGSKWSWGSHTCWLPTKVKFCFLERNIPKLGSLDFYRLSWTRTTIHTHTHTYTYELILKNLYI